MSYFHGRLVLGKQLPHPRANLFEFKVNALGQIEEHQ
jgi:hypothetical protein